MDISFWCVSIITIFVLFFGTFSDYFLYLELFAQSSLSVDHVMVEDPSEEEVKVISL